MKTAVSIPDDVYEQAEEYAKRTRRSRSRVYADALRQYLDENDPDSITARINRVADEGLLEIDPFVAAASRRVLEKTEW